MRAHWQIINSDLINFFLNNTIKILWFDDKSRGGIQWLNVLGSKTEYIRMKSNSEENEYIETV